MIGRTENLKRGRSEKESDFTRSGKRASGLGDEGSCDGEKAIWNQSWREGLATGGEGVLGVWRKGEVDLEDEGDDMREGKGVEGVAAEQMYMRRLPWVDFLKRNKLEERASTSVR